MKISFNQFLGNKTEGRTREGVKRFIRSAFVLAGIKEGNWGANISANNTVRGEEPLDIRKNTPTSIRLTVVLNKRLCSVELTCTKKAEVGPVLQALRTGTLKDGVFLLDKETPAPTEEIVGLPDTKEEIRIEEVVQGEVACSPASDESSDESSSEIRIDPFRLDTDHIELAFLQIWEDVGNDKMRTFSKDDAMDWMMQSFSITTRLLAGRVIQTMITCGVIERVHRDKKIIRFTELGRTLGGNGAKGFPIIEPQRRTRKISAEEEECVAPEVIETADANEPTAEADEFEHALASLNEDDARTARQLLEVRMHMRELGFDFIRLTGYLRQSLGRGADGILALIAAS